MLAILVYLLLRLCLRKGLRYLAKLILHLLEVVVDLRSLDVQLLEAVGSFRARVVLGVLLRWCIRLLHFFVSVLYNCILKSFAIVLVRLVTYYFE